MIKEKSHTLILLSWIHNILLFEGIYVLTAAIREIRGREAVLFLLGGLILIFPIALSYIVIRRCRNLGIFLVFSLAVTWGIQAVIRDLLATLLTAFVFLFRIYVKIKQGEIRRKMQEMPGEAGAQEDREMWEVPTLLDAPRTPYCLIFAAMYLGVVSFHRQALLNLMLGLLGAEISVCLAYRYLERLDGFVRQNVRVANLPAHAMKRIGNAILLTGIAGLAICMLPAAIYHKEPLSDLRFESPEMKGQMELFYEEEAEPNYLMEELARLKSQAKETPEWLKKFSELLGVLTMAGLIYAALRIILRLFRHAMVSFSDDGGDEIIFLNDEAGLMPEKRRLMKRRERDGLHSPDRKIRRLYKRLIRRALREKPYGTETPSELEHKAGLYADMVTNGDTDRLLADTVTSMDIGRIHALYEKARYAKDACTREEAKQTAQILSALRR